MQITCTNCSVTYNCLDSVVLSIDFTATFLCANCSMLAIEQAAAQQAAQHQILIKQVATTIYDPAMNDFIFKWLDEESPFRVELIAYLINNGVA